MEKVLASQARALALANTPREETLAGVNKDPGTWAYRLFWRDEQIILTVF